MPSSHKTSFSLNGLAQVVRKVGDWALDAVPWYSTTWKPLAKGAFDSLVQFFLKQDKGWGK